MRLLGYNFYVYLQTKKKYWMRSYLILILTSIAVQLYATEPSITTKSPTQTSLCAGGNIIVEYETEGSFAFGCTFTAQLSDSWGNFNNAVNVGSVPFNTGIIIGTIPNNTSFGFNYRVRVVASNPAIIGSTSPLPAIVITSSAISASIVTNPGREVCEGTNVTLWVANNESYFWSTGETTQSIQVNETGTYSVTVTNYITGCQVSAAPVDITVFPLPDVDIGNDTSFCKGDTLVLDAGDGYTNYNWNNTPNSGRYYVVDETGEYFVKVKDTNNCQNTDTIVVIVHENPLINLGEDTVICGNQYTLLADTVFTYYNWNNNLSMNFYFQVIHSGHYHIVVTDANGCKGFDTVYVELFKPPDISLGNEIAACGNSVILNAGQGYASYDWNNGQGASHIFHASTSGVYHVEVIDTNGCSGSDSVLVNIYPLPYISLGPDIEIDFGTELTLWVAQGYASYLWSNGETSNYLVFNGNDSLPGDYHIHVSVYDTNGCFNSDHITITMLDSLGSIVFDRNSYINTKVFPNPFKNGFNLTADMDKLKNFEIILTDISGRIIPIHVERNFEGYYISGLDSFQGNCLLFARQGNYQILLARLVAL